MTDYTNYLKTNSLVREELFNHRLFYDLKKAAAKREYHLKIFRTTVDFEGFDIVVDDNSKIGRYQIKTRLNSKVSSWQIHMGMLLPNKRNAELIRFDNGLCSHNDNGVILMDIKSNEQSGEDFKINYYYTDYYIIKSISAELIKRYKTTIKLANKIIEQLVLAKRMNSKIKINKSLFIQVKNPNSLLELCGFDCSENIQVQFLCMKLFSNNKIKIKDIDFDTEFLADKKAFLYQLNSLIIK
jgi:hypothetical protein